MTDVQKIEQAISDILEHLQNKANKIKSKGSSSAIDNHLKLQEIRAKQNALRTLQGYITENITKR